MASVGIPSPSPTRRQVNAVGYDGKFRRRRGEWKFLPLGILLRVLSAAGLGAGIHFIRLGVAAAA